MAFLLQKDEKGAERYGTFFSYRAEGPTTGRIAAIVAIK